MPNQIHGNDIEHDQHFSDYDGKYTKARLHRSKLNYLWTIIQAPFQLLTFILAVATTVGVLWIIFSSSHRDLQRSLNLVHKYLADDDEFSVFSLQLSIANACIYFHVFPEYFRKRFGGSLRNVLSFETFVKNKNDVVNSQRFENLFDQLSTFKYDCNTCYMVYNDHPSAFVFRNQISGTCFMSAALVMQSVLVALHTNHPKLMINLPAYLLQPKAKPMLRKYIMESGGDSFYFLKTILADRVALSVPLTTANELQQTLLDSKILLVPGFAVYSEFYSSYLRYHLGEPTGYFTGRHSLLLIGFKSVMGHTYFLLQNSWASKPFVEVDFAYLKSCATEVVRVINPQPYIPVGFNVTSGWSYFEMTKGMGDDFDDGDEK